MYTTFKAVLFPVTAAACFVLAYSLPATAYTQPASVIAGGGGSSSSDNFSNIGVIGQPGIVGRSASASFTTDHGFLPVLGGWRILYPVISASPGSLTFNLVQGNNSDQSLAIANAGGSILNWSVAKGGTAVDWLSFSPATGTGSASVTVTANAAGLTAGSYNGTLTVSGAGISETVEVQIALTVQASLYRLTLTVKSDTAGKGGGSVHGGISCSGAGATGSVCTADFSPGTTVTLYQTPDSNSTWAAWTGPCTSSGNDCTVTMDGAKDVTATFPYAYMAKLTNGNRYDTLTEALTNAATIDTILARDVTFTGDLTLINKIITLTGGLSAWYLPQNAWSILNGKLILQSGSLTVEKLVIK